jgi:cysteine desulfurase/selenocysteine lyase
MTTSEPNKPQSANGVSRYTGSGYGAGSNQPQLNEAMLSNLASELMAALPGALQTAQNPVSSNEIGVFLQQVDAVASLPDYSTVMPASVPGSVPTSMPGGFPAVSGSMLSGIPNGITTGSPIDIPVGVPMNVPAGAPAALPGGIPTVPPSPIPAGAIPAVFPAGTTGFNPSGLPTTLPATVPGRLPVDGAMPGMPAGAPVGFSAGIPTSVPTGITSSSFSDANQFAGALSFIEEARPLFDAATDLTKMSESMFASPFTSAGMEPSTFDAMVSPHALDSDFSDVARLLQTADPTFGAATYLASPITGGFNVDAVRRDFPILNEVVNGRRLVWFDNAATTQKPQSVIDRLSYFYEHENSNIHRAAHELAARSTDAYEKSREAVRRFINAPSVNDIVFVRGATEGLNFIAQSWGRKNIQKDDEIVISWLEHHANIVPWQMLCAEKGARLKIAPVDNHGQIILDEYERLLNHKTVLVSITQVSNALGTVAPIKPMIDAAHRFGAKVIVDGAQAISHMSVDVQEYDCDFYVFSGHKVYAPTGIGVVYGKSAILESMPPWQGGGNMIQDVTFERTLYQPPPGRFEAGTGNIADAIGLGAAIEYLERLGMHNVSHHESDLLRYMTEGLSRIPGLHMVGTAAEKAGVISFIVDGFKTDEVSKALNLEGIAVRGGHHCAQPILRRFGLESSVRASLGVYNTCEDVDALIGALWKIVQGRGGGPL